MTVRTQFDRALANSALTISRAVRPRRAAVPSAPSEPSGLQDRLPKELALGDTATIAAVKCKSGGRTKDPARSSL